MIVKRELHREKCESFSSFRIAQHGKHKLLEGGRLAQLLASENNTAAFYLNQLHFIIPRQAGKHLAGMGKRSLQAMIRCNLVNGGALSRFGIPVLYAKFLVIKDKPARVRCELRCESVRGLNREQAGDRVSRH